MSDFDYSFDPEDEEDEGRLPEKLRPMYIFEKVSLRSLTSRNLVVWMILVVFMMPFILFIFPQLVGASDSFIVRSGSMEPRIKTGGIVFIYPVNPENLEKGDVITFENDFQSGPDLTTHQIIKIQERNNSYRFRTKGVANEDPDPGWVEENEVIGKVGFSIPFAGYLIAWIGSTKFFIALAVISALLIVIDELKSLREEITRLKKFSRDQEIIVTVTMALSILILLISAASLTGVLKPLTGSSGLAIGRTGFLAVLLFAITIFSMLGLRIL